MKESESEFLKKLLSTFKVEAADHIKVLSSGLIELEKVTDEQKQSEIVEKVFREAHSLKGASRAVNISGIEHICQSMESIFSSIKKKSTGISTELLDLLHNAVDTLKNILSGLESESPQSDKAGIDSIVYKLESYLKDDKQTASRKDILTKSPERKKVPVHSEAAAAGTVRVAVSKLDSLFLQAEEMVSTKLFLGQRAADLVAITSAANTWKKEWSKINSSLRSLQHTVEKDDQQNNPIVRSHLKKILEFTEWSNIHLRSLEDKISAAARAALHDQRAVSLMVDDLLGEAKRTLMFSFTSLLEIFPKFVRDLSRDQNKNVELEIEGAEIEIDRRILEEIKDPLIHLVRNCIDHGIESPDKRRQKKKPLTGKIKINVAQKNGDKVEITISDDGAGIDAEKIRSAVVKNEILQAEEAKKLTVQELHSLVFQTGISTSPIITDVSGRGLGLAIVREKVEKLGGNVSFDTELNTGTTFHIILPLTLATYRGLLVKVNELNFIIPITNIKQVVSVNKNEIRSVENRETILLNGEVLSLVKMADALELSIKQQKNNSSYTFLAVVLSAGSKQAAFLVDEILHEQEVLVKGLGPQLSRVRNIAGAAVMGSGAVVPVLNIHDLIKSSLKVSPKVKGDTAAPKVKEENKKSVLVVEDSITARSLLKNILESSGYVVSTAVDGVDAFTQLRTGTFDIVISDVDMPRMNGFDLTAKIRADKKTAEIPVILVTALESREDKERGIDVGANAYIVKSSFDQGNLLGAIKRLL